MWRTCVEHVSNMCRTGVEQKSNMCLTLNLHIFRHASSILDATQRLQHCTSHILHVALLLFSINCLRAPLQPRSALSVVVLAMRRAPCRSVGSGHGEVDNATLLSRLSRAESGQDQRQRPSAKRAPSANVMVSGAVDTHRRRPEVSDSVPDAHRQEDSHDVQRGKAKRRQKDSGSQRVLLANTATDRSAQPGRAGSSSYIGPRQEVTAKSLAVAKMKAVAKSKAVAKRNEWTRCKKHARGRALSSTPSALADARRPVEEHRRLSGVEPADADASGERQSSPRGQQTADPVVRCLLPFFDAVADDAILDDDYVELMPCHHDKWQRQRRSAFAAQTKRTHAVSEHEVHAHTT